MSIIAISRGTRSGGLELADRLAERLGYATLSREEVIAESAREFNVMEEFLRLKLDKTPSLWQKFTNEHQRHISFIQCALLQAVRKDNVIYHGHAGQFLLKDLPNVLKLRIEAPVDYRLRAVMAELGYDRDEAAAYIERVDDERRHWVKMVYNQDWCDPALYDLCVNLQNMSLDTICDLVEHAVGHDDFRTSDEARKQLNDAALRCSVTARLSADDKIWGSGHQVDVIARDGVIYLRGSTRNEELREMIVRTVAEADGVSECRPEIHLLSDTLR